MTHKQFTRFVATLKFVAVDEDLGDCWIWTGTRRAGAYGRFCEGKNKLAHRVAYEHFVGEIPVGTEIDHLCRQTLCVNPRHLEAVAHRMNIARGLVPGNQHGRGKVRSAAANAATGAAKRAWCAANPARVRAAALARWVKRKQLGLGGTHRTPHTPETREKLSASWTAERRAKQAAFKRAYWARKKSEAA